MPFATRPLLAFVALLPWTLCAQAPPASPSLDGELASLLATPVEVASTRQQGVLTTPSTVTVLTREMLERYGIRTVAQAVDLVTGMAVQRSIFNSDMPTSRGILQEGYANRVLLLINGVATWNAMTGDLCLSRMDLEDVQKIEVLRGPASVLYGTNAYAGAINLVLRRRVADGRMVRAGLSSRGGHQGGGNLSVAAGDWMIFAAAGQGLERGRNQDLAGESGTSIHLEDVRRTRTANLHAANATHAVLVNAFDQEGTFLGATVTAATGAGQDLRNRGLLATYQFDGSLSETWRLRYQLSCDSSLRTFTANQDGSRAYQQQGQRLTHALMSTWNPSPRFGLEVHGAMETRENAHYTLVDLGSGATLLEALPRGVSLRERSAYVQANFQAGDWSALLGSRYTRNDNFGSNVSSRASLVWSLDEHQSLKWMWGQSFRAPSLLEQYLSIPGVAFGSQDLAPETSSTFEVAYLLATGPLFLQVQGFDSSFRNKLFRVRRDPQSADPTVVYRNGGTFHRRGLGVETRLQPGGGFTAFLNADWSRGDQGDAFPGSRGFNDLFVPAFNARMGLSQSWGQWTLSLILRHQGPALSAVSSIPAWTGLDVGVGFTQTRGQTVFRHRLFLDNAGDRERWFAEYTRRLADRVPEGMGRMAGYRLTVTF